MKGPIDTIDTELKYKYTKRTGSSGNYTYWYKNPNTGKLEAGSKPSDKEKNTAKKEQFPTKKPAEYDKEGAREAQLQIENDGDFYRQRLEPTHKNFVNKIADGKYNESQATYHFFNLVKDFHKQHSEDLGPMDKNTMLAVAVEMQKEFYDMAKDGDYDHMLTSASKKRKDAREKGKEFDKVSEEDMKKRHTGSKADPLLPNISSGHTLETFKKEAPKLVPFNHKKLVDKEGNVLAIYDADTKKVTVAPDTTSKEGKKEDAPDPEGYTKWLKEKDIKPSDENLKKYQEQFKTEKKGCATPKKKEEDTDEEEEKKSKGPLDKIKMSY